MDLMDEFHQLADNYWSKPKRKLVNTEDLWIEQESLSQRQLLLLTP